MPNRLASLLLHRWFFVATLGLGVTLALPSLSSGFVADDYMFLNRLEQSAQPPTSLVITRLGRA